MKQSHLGDAAPIPVWLHFLWVTVLTSCTAINQTPAVEPGVAASAKAGISMNAEWDPYLATMNGVEMVLVPAGCFPMGSNAGHSTGGMAPVHKVCFTEPFWLDIYEVSQAQFAEFGGEAARESCFKGPNRPRECLTWFEAQDFCELRGARLPSEAEWEYAARGPDGLRFPWGETFEPDYVIFPANSRQETADVGGRPGGASWVGAQDLSGNVWEWANDWYGEFYYGTLEDGTVNPQGPEAGTQRVLRGGSWVTLSVVRFIAIRYQDEPDDWTPSHGFRCAMSYQP